MVAVIYMLPVGVSGFGCAAKSVAMGPMGSEGL